MCNLLLHWPLDSLSSRQKVVGLCVLGIMLAASSLTCVMCKTLVHHCLKMQQDHVCTELNQLINHVLHAWVQDGSSKLAFMKNIVPFCISLFPRPEEEEEKGPGFSHLCMCLITASVELVDRKKRLPTGKTIASGNLGLHCTSVCPSCWSFSLISSARLLVKVLR